MENINSGKVLDMLKSTFRTIGKAFDRMMQFGMQALINMASALHLIPTKGMTLPFISYGGSSMLAESLVAGLMLCFSRERACEENVRYFR